MLADRSRFPRDKACSEYMSPETVRQLDALGVLEQLDLAGGAALDGTRVTGPAGSELTGRFARAGGTPFRATGLGLSRRTLDAALVQAARDAGVTVIEAARADALVRDARGGIGGAVIEVAGTRRTVHARVVVGADGLGSVVARRAGLHRSGHLRRVAFVAHLRGVAGLSETTELHVAHGGYVGINALGGDLANVALVLPAAMARAARGDVAGFFRAQLQRFPGVAARVAGASVVREVLATGPFDAQSRCSTADGLLLVGDAADFFDPFTGEGICTALIGASFAATAIDDALQQRGPIRHADLRSYRVARRQAFLGKWIVERLIGYGMLAPALFDRAIGRLERRGMADTLIGVTGQFVSPWRVVNPVFLARMVW
jgi:flavin-dependent dehydrogenase